MSDADRAFEAAERLIAEAAESGAEVLDLDRAETHALTRLPDSIRKLDNLTLLVLDNTAITDLSPLAGLTALQTLRLNHTQVSDLAPLANLSALQTLWLDQTQVSDLAPLANLSALQTLTLDQTEVSDLSPLANLSALQILGLNQTQVTNPSPLADLSALQALWLGQTQISDLSPLANLSALQTLGLNQTEVGDLSPLANLSALQSLRLGQTQVSDLSPLRPLTRLATDPGFGGLTFGDTPATSANPRLAQIAAIEDDSDRAQALFDWLDAQDGAEDGALVPKADSPQPDMEKVDLPAVSPDLAPAIRKISVTQIREALRSSYPDLKDRTNHLMGLVAQEQAAHALIPKPNSPEGQTAWDDKMEFLRTIEAGLVGLHLDLPETLANQPISEASATDIRAKLVSLATVVDKSIRELDKANGTYGSLYKIGLSLGFAGIVGVIAPITFPAAAGVTAAIVSAQTVSDRKKAKDTPDDPPQS